MRQMFFKNIQMSVTQSGTDKMTKISSCLVTFLAYYIIFFLLTVSLHAETSISPSLCQGNCWCMNINRSVDCSGHGLFRLPPLSSQIIKLDLSGNLLGPMINGSFGSLTELQEIDLSGNMLSRLLLCTFAGLLHLRHVNLHGNNLKSLPSGLFADNDQLESLDLSHNEFEHLPDLLLHGIPALQVLNISHNQITQLKLGLRFQPLTRLHILDFSHNRFYNVSSDAFEMAKNWEPLVHRSLDISYCQIENIASTAFQDIPGLTHLSLAGNDQLPFQQITDLLKELENSGLQSINLSNMSISDPALFSTVTLMALLKLDLSKNLITSIPAGTFGNIRSLEYLNLSHNLLQQMDEGLGDMTNLVDLSISHCRLMSFKGTHINGLQRLEILDLSHNFLSDPADVDLSSLRKLRILDLSFNRLQASVLPGNTQHLVVLSFASNNLTSLSSMPNMQSLRFFDARKNNIQTIGPFLFTEANGVISANFSHNQLTDVDHRAFLPHSPKIIDLSSNRLTKTEFYSLTSTTELYLHNNYLKDLDQQTFYGMDRLNILDLSLNNLSVIQDQTFKFLRNLKILRVSNNILQMHDFSPLFHSLQSLQELDLGQNKISLINATSFQGLFSLTSLSLKLNDIKVMPAELFDSLENLTELDISGNPFDCGCDLLSLQEWLKTTKVKVKQRFDLNITNTCKTPVKHENKLVTHFSVDQFECNTKMLYLIVFGSIGGFAIISGLVGSLLCHYCRRQQRHRSRKNFDRIKQEKHEKQQKQLGRVNTAYRSKHTDILPKQDLINGWIVSQRVDFPKKPTDLAHHKESLSPYWKTLPLSRPTYHTNGGIDRLQKRKEYRKDSHYYIPNVRYDSLSQSPSKMLMVQSPFQGQWSVQQTHPIAPPMVRHGQYNEAYHHTDHKQPSERMNTLATSYQRLPRELSTYRQETDGYFTLPYVSGRQRPPYGPSYPYRIVYNKNTNPQIHSSRTFPKPPQSGRGDIMVREDHSNCADEMFRKTRHDNHGQLSAGEANELEKRQTRNADAASQKQDEEKKNLSHKRWGLPKDDSSIKHNTVNSRMSDRDAPTKTLLMKRGKSETRINGHRRDAEYQHAMENPVVPRTLSSPTLLGNKTSDWL